MLRLFQKTDRVGGTMDNHQRKAAILIFVLLKSCCGNLECQESTEKESLPDMTDIVPTNYNEQLPPYRPGCPAEVNVSILPWGIGDISFEHRNFEVNLYLKLDWIDYRLNFSNSVPKQINLEESVAAKIWTPDVSFRNCIKCNVIKFDHRLHKITLKRNVLSYFIRTNAKLLCDFDLSKYPMDRHNCFIEVESFGDLKETVVLIDGTPWHYFLRKASLPQFEVSNLMTGNCSTPDATSNFVTCVEYRMTFTRQLEYHLMLTYAPSCLIVVLTWISFWLEVESAPPRVALGLTSLLTLATQFANAQKDLPPVSYAKAIDIWMFTCIFMVFGSLLEFAIAYNINQRKKEVGPQQINFIPTHWPQKKIFKKENSKVDSVSKILFPLAFLAFNICYWGYFCTRY